MKCFQRGKTSTVFSLVLLMQARRGSRSTQTAVSLPPETCQLPSSRMTRGASEHPRKFRGSKDKSMLHTKNSPGPLNFARGGCGIILRAVRCAALAVVASVVGLPQPRLAFAACNPSNAATGCSVAQAQDID